MSKIINAVLQIDESQHMSEERVGIGYKDENSEEIRLIFVNISDLDTKELKKYQDFKDLLISKLPE